MTKDNEAFIVTRKIYDEFVERINNPPNPNKKLKELFKTKSPWELEEKIKDLEQKARSLKHKP